MNKPIMSMATIAIMIITGFCSHAQAVSCGVWWWTKSDHPWGLVNIVGNTEKESAGIEELQRWNIDRVYGSYGTRPMDEPSIIYNWNRKLDEAGVSSEILLSENTWIFPENRTNLLKQHIQPKLIDFNKAASTPAERFDSLHLDVEPQGLPQWKTAEPSERNSYLLLLRDMFHDVRTYLDEHTSEHMPVYADLPVWFDLISDTTGWTNETDRDAWFASLQADLDGISLMAYERSSLSSISNGVEWEISHMTNEVRIGLEVDIGANETWPTFSALTSMLAQAQSALTPGVGTDIHAFYSFEDYVPPFTSRLDIVSYTQTGLIFNATHLSPGKTNWLEYSNNLSSNNWHFITSFVSWSSASNLTQSFTSRTEAIFLRLTTPTP